MQYKINHGCVAYAADVVLKDINFEIRDTEKIAVVGRNGCGKTTLLKLIAGELELEKRDSDEDIFIAKSGNPTIGYLKQMTFADKSISMEEEIRKVFVSYENLQQELETKRKRMEEDPSEESIASYTKAEEYFVDIGGYYYEKEYETMIRKFGFTAEDKKKPIAEFSGGQQTKIAFIKMLLEKPDILLLDEPTNHLDIETIEWLENYLKNYKRAVVIVSHDRMFLDDIVDVVYEIEYGKSTRYKGNYTAFMEQKRQRWEKQAKDYEAQQKEIARLNAIVERFKGKPTKVSMAKSKLKQIEHMDLVEPPQRYDNQTFHAHFNPEVETGKEVLTVKNLQIGYEDGKVLSTVNLQMQRGEKIGIIGGNGLGKSTFLKTVTGKLHALGGEYEYGIRVQIGYFDQQMAQYTSKKQVLDDFWDEFPELTQTEVRSALGAFLFSGDEVFKTVDMLSGGERVRLALCKILKRKPNLLILDEPTNHMDIIGKETLEQMLKSYTGTVLFVSHDRYFVKQVAQKILAFEPDGSTQFYQFGYEEYQTKKQQEEELAESQGYVSKKNPPVFTGNLQAANEKKAVVEKSTAKKYQNPGKERSKLEKKLKKIEEQIAVCEEKTEALKAELLKPEYAASYSKLSEIQEQIDASEEELLEVMQQWEEAQEALEAFEASLM
ncbi:MAG: ABC-F family ATP-binding cassette domain-containing protein [Lachnospiraceae bacterium]